MNFELSQQSEDTSGSHPTGVSDIESKIIRKQLELFEVSDDIDPTEEYINKLKQDVSDIESDALELTEKLHKWKNGTYTVDHNDKTDEERKSIKTNTMKCLTIAIIKKLREKLHIEKNMSVAQSNLRIMKTEVALLELQLSQLLEADYDMNN